MVGSVSSQHSQSIARSRRSGVTLVSSQYVFITWRGVRAGCPRRSFQHPSHFFSIKVRSASDKSFCVYRSRNMAIASMSQLVAVWPKHLHALHWMPGWNGQRC